MPSSCPGYRTFQALPALRLYPVRNAGSTDGRSGRAAGERQRRDLIIVLLQAASKQGNLVSC